MKYPTKFKQTEIGKIPEDWNIAKLGNVSEKIFTGRDPVGGELAHSKESTEYRLIRSAEVFDGFLKSDLISHIDENIAKILKSAEVVDGDVLLNQLGDGITFARSCVVPVIKYKAFVTRSVGVIRTNREILNPSFLNAYFILPKTKQYIESFNSGSSRRAIDGGKMKQFLIPLPDLKEQNTIATFYNNIHLRTELFKEQNKTLEAIGQAIFKHWFIDFEFPNEEGKPYKSSGGEMVESELGTIPSEWKVCLITDVAEVVDCLHSKKPQRIVEGPILLQVYNISEYGLLDFKETYSVSVEDYKVWTRNVLVREGDCILTNAGLAGAMAQIPYGLNAGLGRNLTAVRSKKIPPTYLINYLFSEYGKKQIKQNLDTGTIFDSLNVKGIRNLKVLVPSEKMTLDFESIARPLRKYMEKNVYENLCLSQIRDSILPKLMSGAIRVKMPASATYE